MKGIMISRNMFRKSSRLQSIFEDFESLEFLTISELPKRISQVVSRASERQTTPSLQITTNEQELAFPMLTTTPATRQASEHDEEPVQPARPMGGGKPDCMPGVLRQRFRGEYEMGRQHFAV
ncbi:MAG: hypothetical protein AB7E46_02550 [Desulfovibrio sp.]